MMCEVELFYMTLQNNNQTYVVLFMTERGREMCWLQISLQKKVAKVSGGRHKNEDAIKY